MNVAILGGTFDPIHNGHLKVAEEVSKHLSAKVIFIPAGQPWLKAELKISAPKDRVEMIRRAIDGDARYSLSTVEIERLGPTYTIDTIRQIQERLGPSDEVFFILGYDNFLNLSQWHEADALTKLCQFVVVPRCGYKEIDLSTLDTALPALAQRVIMMAQPLIDISASNIRDRISKGLSVEHLVPATVAEYIRDKYLYL
ncbi:MAG: nicotinate-nucleotide adenylyltransferase [Dehalococcoidia bacterium]|nr:nicotinate-nucleotide adenylyltransferase [Dehalococcoidia bacterium]